MKKILLKKILLKKMSGLLFSVLFTSFAFAQLPAGITISPENATAYDELTITLTPALLGNCSTLGAEEPHVHIHSGVTIEDTGWGDVVAWDAAGASTELTDNGNGTWSITLTPFAFYGFADGSVVTHIDAVFNAGTWDRTAKQADNCVDFKIPLATTTTEIENELTENISVFPNPVEQTIYIKNVADINKITIYSLVGQRIIELTNALSKNIEIDASALQSGIYLLEFISETGELSTRKIMKK